MPSRELVLRLVSDAKDFGRGFSKAERDASQFSRGIARAFGASSKDIDTRARALDATFGKLAVGIGGTLVAVQGLQAGFRIASEVIQGAVRFGSDAVQSFSNLNESINAVNVSFGDASRGIQELGETSAQNLGLTTSEFNGLAVSFEAFASDIAAGSGRSVIDVIDELTTRGADFASVFNLDVNDALDKFRSGLAGESEPLRRFGIDLSAASVQAYAYANGIAATGAELTESQKIQARYGTLLEQTSQVQGDFANTSGELANQLRIAGAEFENAKASIGEQLLPVVEEGVAILPKLIDAFESLAPAIRRAADAAVEGAPDIAGFVETLPNAVGFVGDVGKAIGGSFSAIQSTAEALFNVGDAFRSIGTAGAADTQIQQALDDFRDVQSAFDDISEAVDFGKLNRAITDGLDPGVAYATVLRDIGTEGGITQDRIRDLAAVAGLTTQEQQRQIGILLEQGQSLGITEQALDDLAGAWVDLQVVLDQASEQDAIERALDVEQFYSSGQGVDIQAAARQVASDIESANEEIAKAAQDSLDELNKAIESTAADFSENISIFAEAPTELEAVDLGAALSNIQAQIEQLDRFNAAIQTLKDSGLSNVVADLTAQGPQSVATAEALAGDLGAAFDLEEAIKEGNTTALDGAVTAILGQSDQYGDDFAAVGVAFANRFEEGFASLDFTSIVARAVAEVRTGTKIGERGSNPTPIGLGGGGILEGRARGGPVSANRPYLVGEERPELFVPNTAGRILPLGMTGGGGFNYSPTVNVQGEPNDLGRVLDIQRQLVQASVGRMIEAM